MNTWIGHIGICWGDPSSFGKNPFNWSNPIIVRLFFWGYALSGVSALFFAFLAVFAQELIKFPRLKQYSLLGFSILPKIRLFDRIHKDFWLKLGKSTNRGAEISGNRFCHSFGAFR